MRFNLLSFQGHANNNNSDCRLAACVGTENNLETRIVPFCRLKYNIDLTAAEFMPRLNFMLD